MYIAFFAGHVSKSLTKGNPAYSSKLKILVPNSTQEVCLSTLNSAASPAVIDKVTN